MQEEIILKEKAVLNEGIATKEKQEISNSKKKDSSSKIIFGNHELCAQFLKGYTEIPFLCQAWLRHIEKR